MADYPTTDTLGTGQYPSEIPSDDITMYAGGSNTFDESSPNNSDLGNSTPVVVGGVIYTQNADGTWTGSDGAHGSDSDMQALISGDQSTPTTDYSNEGKNNPTPVGTGGDTWDKIATALKLKNPDGSYDWAKLLAATGVGVSAIGSMTQTPEKQKTIAELRAGMPAMNATQSFTPETLAMMQRPMQTGSALQRVYAADMQQPFAKGQTTKGYADGGEVMPGEMQEMPGALSQAFSGAVQGNDGGQSDLVDAKLSAGEYVLDAETVSALGDGNTAAGIAKLDELRAKLREQKRSAPTQDIPPQAQGPLSYMQGA